MRGDNQQFTVQVDRPGPQRGDRTSVYPPAGPVGEGAGNGVGAAVEAGKGGAKKKILLILTGLVLLAAAICGVGWFVFLKDSGGSTDSSTATTGASDSDAAVTDRGGTVTAPSADSSDASAPATADGGEESTADDASPETGTPDTDTGTDASAPVEATEAGTAANATDAANATATVMQTIPVNAQLGSYDESIPLDVIPVAIAVLPSGKVLAWSAETPDDFYRKDRYIVGGGGSGKTYHSVWDPATNEATGLLVSNTNHDMFCPGITMMANGDVMVTGGQNANRTSIYQLASDSWVASADMAISRGYGSSCLLSNGKVFVLGGSWSGPEKLKKDAEIYDPTAGTWSNLPGIQAAYILTDDPEDLEEGRIYRRDNYGMFHSWSDGTVFHAGPSDTLYWFSTDGEGSALTAGESTAGNIANGNSVMFDTGKILNCGGSESFAFEEYPAKDTVTLITINVANTQAVVKELPPMKLPRVYANGVVLPDGKVLINGGASHPLEFSDKYAYYQPEIWDPATEEFTLLDAKHVNGRTYHSTAALLPDGRVVTGGGGLCGSGLNGVKSLCKGDVDPNHLDFEIFNPPYLFAEDGSEAPRPAIELSANTAKHGASFTVTSSEPLMMVSFIRMGSATHSTNTDQRRLELCGPFNTPCGASPVTVSVPTDPGIALPGNWMVFGVNAAGVPSVASTVLVGL